MTEVDLCTYCAACEHPTDEHGDDGTCHALDMPRFGIVNDCSCPGLTGDPGSLGMDRTGLPEGILGAVVGPAYAALASSETEYVPPRHRALITWTEVWDLGAQQVVGHCHPDTLPGEYCYVQYFRHPTEPAYLAGRLDQPVTHPGGPKAIGPISMSADLIIAQI